MGIVDLKFYIARPTGHGQYTFGTLTTTLELAKKIISEHIDRKYRHDDGSLTYEAQGFGTEDYDWEIYEQGQIFENAND